MEIEKISLRPRPIAPKPVMFLISPETTVAGTESTQESSANIRLPESPAIDETMENAPLADESNIDEMKSKVKTPAVIETDCTETKDNEDDITALVVASSNIRSSPKGRTNTSGRKKPKYIRDVETSLSLLLPDNKEVADEKAFNFAQAYFLKVKETLEESDSGTYQQFLETLNDFGSKVTTAPDLYKEVSSILCSYPDLVSEFVVFLLPEQAMQCGKLIEHLMLTKMSNFLRRLEIYFKRQPQQQQKVYSALTLLSTQTCVTVKDIRSTVLPLLKGNTFLIESFLEIMPPEHLPDSLMTDFDEMSCVEVDSDNIVEDDQVETLIVPDQEDKYGSDTCICTCHNSTKQKYRSRFHHCVPCGTKFIHGRVFMQIGKGLRPAKVIFPDSDMAACIERLSPKQCIKTTCKKGSGHNESGAMKETSPSKATQNAVVVQHNSNSQSDVSNLAGKDTIKPKNIKQRAVNKKVLEGNRADSGSTRNNFPITHATKKSKNSGLKVSIKVPKLSGENGTGNNSLSKKGSVKRSRSTSRNRVRQKSVESGNKSPVPYDKQVADDTVSSICISSSQEKNDQVRDCQSQKPPAKKQCRLTDNVSSLESLVINSDSAEISPVETCNVYHESQLLKQPSVVSKCATTTSETINCRSGGSLPHVDPVVSKNTDNLVCDNSSASSLLTNISDLTDASVDVKKEQHIQENSNTLMSAGSAEPVATSKSAGIVQSFEQECEKNIEKSSSFPDSHQETDGKSSRDNMPSYLCPHETTQMTWTKEEDKVILKMFQQECAPERILYMIRQQLPQRSVEQIQNRFQTLMNLLQKMTGVRMDDEQGV